MKLKIVGAKDIHSDFQKILSAVEEAKKIKFSIDFVEDIIDGKNLNNWLNGTDYLYLTESVQRKAITFSEQYSAEVSHIGSADWAINKHGKWNFKNYFYFAAQSALANEWPQVDRATPFLIIGNSCEARSLMVALIKSGFSHVRLCGLKTHLVKDFYQDMLRNLLSVKSEFIDVDGLSELESDHTIVINAISNIKQDRWLEKLSYLNFLRSDGIWLDLYAHQELAEEVKSVGGFVAPRLKLVKQSLLYWARDEFSVEITL